MTPSISRRALRQWKHGDDAPTPMMMPRMARKERSFAAHRLLSDTLIMVQKSIGSCSSVVNGVHRSR
jgi:hypothetical protein